MASIPGTNIAAKIAPFDTADTFATHDEKYGLGGYRSVDSITDRNNITESRQKVGMLVYVVNEDITYRLVSTGSPPLTNSNWEETSLSASSISFDNSLTPSITGDNVQTAIENLDAQVLGLSGDYVFKSGDTMTGPLTIDTPGVTSLTISGGSNGQAAVEIYANESSAEILTGYNFNGDKIFEFNTTGSEGTRFYVNNVANSRVFEVNDFSIIIRAKTLTSDDIEILSGAQNDPDAILFNHTETSSPGSMGMTFSITGSAQHVFYMDNNGDMAFEDLRGYSGGIGGWQPEDGDVRLKIISTGVNVYDDLTVLSLSGNPNEIVTLDGNGTLQNSNTTINDILVPSSTSTGGTSGSVLVVDSVPLSGGFNGSNWIVVVETQDEANMRTSTVLGVWKDDGSSIQFSESSTTDIGDTSNVTLNLVLNGSNIELQASITGPDTWDIKSKRLSI